MYCLQTLVLKLEHEKEDATVTIKQLKEQNAELQEASFKFIVLPWVQLQVPSLPSMQAVIRLLCLAGSLQGIPNTHVTFV